MKSNAEVPIFLRKTYHMIDTCDVSIASWSEDGETFVVKQPENFSSKIIPQFFKHSKFSSFVRQLNFYGFRKIKYSDSIKIDEKLERETKDYWRFRHECFRKGREDLLTGIKRSNSTQNDKKPVVAQTKSVPASAESKTEVNELKLELDTLKDKIAKMNDNMDALTTLVQNVKLEEKKGIVDRNVHVGIKRRKTEVSETDNNQVKMEVDTVMSSVNNDMANIAFTPANIFPAGPGLRQNSETSNLSDAAFVDELFNALDDNDMDILPDPVTSEMMPEMIETPLIKSEERDIPVTPPESPIKQEISTFSSQHPNAPNPETMKKLSEALTVLPKDIQEMLVNRLIATITSSEALKAHLDSITESNEKSVTENQPQKCLTPSGSALENNPEVALPLAAATLTALMTHLSASIKNKSCVPNGKSLPVIPIHA